MLQGRAQSGYGGGCGAFVTCRGCGRLPRVAPGLCACTWIDHEKGGRGANFAQVNFCKKMHNGGDTHAGRDQMALNSKPVWAIPSSWHLCGVHVQDVRIRDFKQIDLPSGQIDLFEARQWLDASLPMA